ncbi:hypothetical protein WMZ97_10695 [Lentibacillus sp. N15]|uniref:hypothetical protein n=1 Tax=Lentibacillus songyuanensis TaxID=3136161 RepID=UPI0031BB6C07
MFNGGRKIKVIEAIIWNIALPGLAQILNGKIIKGLVLVGLGFLVNIQSNLNQAILYSFNGEIQLAIDITNYQLLLFYPCWYIFAMWDVYKDTGSGKESFSFLPFVFSAYSMTVGAIYSPTLKIGGILFGPIWLPTLFLPIGIIVGTVLRILLKKL